MLVNLSIYCQISNFMYNQRKRCLNMIKKQQKQQKQQKSMKELLQTRDQPQMPKVGDIVEGKILEIGPHRIWVDLGPIGTGEIFSREIYGGLSDPKKLKVGDKISASLIDLENEEGFLELSLRRASEKLAWQKLFEIREKDEVVLVKILQANPGGLTCEIKGIPAFIPVSQLSPEHYPHAGGDREKILRKLKEFISKDFKVKIIDLNRREGKIIASEKEAETEKIRQKIKQWKVGDMVEGKVKGVVDFGIFVGFGKGLEGLVHISEISWQQINDPHKIAKVDDKIKTEIIAIDNGRVSLSMKALKKDPWIEAKKKYKVGKKLEGKVTRINPFGAFVELDKSIQGLIHVSEFGSQEREMRDALKVGKSYKFKILSFEPEEHRLGLALIEGKKTKKK